ncbi:MAG: hypothetical protein M3458_08670 [Acidobacteriota bacterium]|nr:hypothetical protein [Acidobacteriota bacterium]
MPDLNVTGQNFKEYLETFHFTLKETAIRDLKPEAQQRSDHLSLQPARIVGYVSTHFGVGFEYFPADKTTIDVEVGNARIEDLLVKAPYQLRQGPPGMMQHGRYVMFENMEFKGRFPFRLAGEDNNIFFKNMLFTATVWNSGGVLITGKPSLRHWRQRITYAEVYGDRKQEICVLVQREMEF